MRTVKINKDKLLEIIKANRLVHIEEYNEAVKKYREASIKEMTENLRIAVDGGEIEHVIRTSQPNSYEDSYNSVISMLELTEDTTIELTAQEFSQYVEDKWGWRGHLRPLTAPTACRSPRALADLLDCLGLLARSDGSN